jgi:hypothetical protein
VARAQAVVKPEGADFRIPRLEHFARPNWGWSADFSVDARGKVALRKQLRRAQVAGFSANMPRA